MLYGCDLSHWNSDSSFKDLLKNKDSFMFLKATEGATYSDPTFKKRAWEALNAGMALGFYHFARPDNNVIAKREAENFLRAVEEFGNNCVYALDWEAKAEKCDPIWILKWCSFIEQKTGRKPMVYLNHSYAIEVSRKIDLSNFPLWVAKWGEEPTGKIGCWEKYTIWQYTNTPYDKNKFDGSVEDFVRIGKIGTGDEFGHYCGCSCGCCKER